MTIDQAQHWVCWEAGHYTKKLNESSNGGDGDSHGTGRDQASAL
jgi:hypothetical protein